MKRVLIALSATALGLGLAAGATAAITEIGMTDAPAPPSCPGSPCLAVSRTTGFQAKIGQQKAPLSVLKAGRIVAWSITQGQPTPAQVKFFDAMEGGVAQASLAVLRPGPKLNFTLVAESPVMKLESYFGTTVQFPLDTTIAVNPGDVIALSVPTWSPALALGFGHDTSWRASRGRTACANTGLPTTQTSIGSSVQYFCLYGTARLTYSATLIPTPTPPVPTPPALTTNPKAPAVPGAAKPGSKAGSRTASPSPTGK